MGSLAIMDDAAAEFRAVGAGLQPAYGLEA